MSLKQHLPDQAYCDRKKVLSFRDNFHGQKMCTVIKKNRLDPYLINTQPGCENDASVQKICTQHFHFMDWYS